MNKNILIYILIIFFLVKSVFAEQLVFKRKKTDDMKFKPSYFLEIKHIKKYNSESIYYYIVGETQDYGIIAINISHAHRDLFTDKKYDSMFVDSKRIYNNKKNIPKLFLKTWYSLSLKRNKLSSDNFFSIKSSNSYVIFYFLKDNYNVDYVLDINNLDEYVFRTIEPINNEPISFKIEKAIE